MTEQQFNRTWLDHPFWDWYEKPFRFALKVTLFVLISPLLLIILLGMAIVMPVAIISNWRSGRRAERKLKTEGRLIDWNDALLERGSNNKELVVEIGPKKVGHVWLVELSPTSRFSFDSYPTFLEFETNSETVWKKYEEENEDDVQQLLPHMLLAKRIERLPQPISDCDKELKDSMKAITVFNEVSPSMLLYNLTAKKSNA